MMPVLLQIGAFKIYTMGVFLTLGLFLGLYYWWKLGRDEHYDETALFDGFFLSVIAFFLIGRAGYVLQHVEDLGTIYRFVAFLRYPGLFYAAGVAGAIMTLINYARAKEWDQWKVADAASVSTSLILVIGSIGSFLNGSNPGIEVSWGLSYPGVSGLRFPVDLWGVVIFLITFGVVMRVRKNFRFYTWYKGDSSVAKDGLALLIFVGMMGLYYLVRGLVDDGLSHLGVIPIMSLSGLGIMISSVIFIMLRSGNDFRRKKQGGLR